MSFSLLGVCMIKKKWLRVFIFLSVVCLCIGASHSVLADSTFQMTIRNYMEEYDGACWFCGVFQSIYDAINTLATNTFNNMAKWFLGLMGIGILFLLLFKVGKMLVQLQDVDVRQFLNDLFKPLGRAIIATALLGVTVAAGSETIFHLLTNPMMTISLGMSEKILSISLNDVKTLQTDTSGNVQKKKLGDIDWDSINSKFENENTEAPSQALGTANKTLLVDWMKKVSSSFVVGIALGGTFIKIGCDSFFSRISMIVAGLVLWFGFWFIYFFFPFRILDAFMRIAFVLTLMPLWIVLWVFPPTQEYTKKAWELFLSSCLIFVSLSVVIAFVLTLIDHVVPANLINSSTNASKTRDEFFQMLIRGEDTEAAKYVSFGSGLILNCIAFTAMGWTLLDTAAVLANSFVGGGANVKTDIGNQSVASAAKIGNVAVSGAKMGVKVGAATGIWAGKKIGGKIAGAVRRRFGGGSGGGGAGAGAGSGPGSGGGSGGGGGGGSSSFTGPPPVVPKGETGKEGRQGIDGRPGKPGKPGEVVPTGIQTPEATDVREDVRPTDAPSVIQPSSVSTAVRQQAADHENELYNTQSDSSGRRRLMASAGPAERKVLDQMSAAMKRGENLTELRVALQQAIAQDVQSNGGGTREQIAAPSAATLESHKHAVQDLAANPQSAEQLRKLSQDVAFIESSMGMNQNDFTQAMQKHDWQTDSKVMQEYAKDRYSYQKLPTFTEMATKRMLKNTPLSSRATESEAARIAHATGQGVEQGQQNVLSQQLNSLANEVSTVPVTRS